MPDRAESLSLSRGIAVRTCATIDMYGLLRSRSNPSRTSSRKTDGARAERFAEFHLKVSACAAMVWVNAGLRGSNAPESARSDSIRPETIQAPIPR